MTNSCVRIILPPSIASTPREGDILYKDIHISLFCDYPGALIPEDKEYHSWFARFHGDTIKECLRQAVEAGWVSGERGNGSRWDLCPICAEHRPGEPPSASETSAKIMEKIREGRERD